MAGPIPPHALVEMGAEESLALAATVPVGRLVFNHGDDLVVIPVNHLLEDGDVLMRTADGSEMLAAARRGASAVLEVDNLENWSRSGWSVLIRGRLSEVSDPAAVDRVLTSRLRPWAHGERDHVLRLPAAQVTGRRIEPGPGGIDVLLV